MKKHTIQSKIIAIILVMTIMPWSFSGLSVMLHVHAAGRSYIGENDDLNGDKNPEAGHTAAEYTSTGRKAEQEELLITGIPASLTYGDTDFILKAEGGSGTGAIMWSSSEEKVAAVYENGMVIIKGAGTATITAVKAADDNYNAVKAVMDLTVSKKKITVAGYRALNKIYDGTTEAQASDFNVYLDGKVNGDDVTFNIGTIKFEDENVGKNKKIIFSGFTLQGSDSDNYELIQPCDQTADILSR